MILSNSVSGKVLRYGARKYGINLVFANQPAYEWYIVGGDTGSPVGSDEFALWNKTSGQFLVYGARTHGINLVWEKPVGIFEES